MKLFARALDAYAPPTKVLPGTIVQYRLALHRALIPQHSILPQPQFEFGIDLELQESN